MFSERHQKLNANSSFIINIFDNLSVGCQGRCAPEFKY